MFLKKVKIQYCFRNSSLSSLSSSSDSKRSFLSLSCESLISRSLSSSSRVFSSLLYHGLILLVSESSSARRSIWSWTWTPRSTIDFDKDLLRSGYFICNRWRHGACVIWLVEKRYKSREIKGKIIFKMNQVIIHLLQLCRLFWWEDYILV